MICSTSLKVLLPTTYVPLPNQLLCTPLMMLVWELPVNWARAEPVKEKRMTAPKRTGKNCFITLRLLLMPSKNFDTRTDGEVNQVPAVKSSALLAYREAL